MQTTDVEIFEEICDFRQPLLFDNQQEQTQIVQTINKDTLLKNFPSFELKIRDTQNTENRLIKNQVKKVNKKLIQNQLKKLKKNIIV